MARRIGLLSLASLSLATGACKSSTASRSEVLTPAQVVVVADPSQTNAPLPPPLPPKPEIACELTCPSWPHSAHLRAEQQGPALVRIGAGPSLEAILHSGEPVAARVRISKQGVHLFGWFAHDELPLHLVEAKVLAGIVAPASHTSLRWGKGEPGRIQVGYAFEDRVAPDAVVWSPLACSEVGLDYTKYDHLTVLPDIDPVDQAMLTAATHVAVAPTPTDEARVSLELAEALEVDVLERRGDRARILLELTDGHLFGWVEGRHLSPVPPNSIGSAFAIGGLGLRGVGQPAPLFECSRELPLNVEQSGETIPIGTLDPGVVFGIVRRAKTSTIIELRALKWLDPLPGVRFTVPTDTLAHCSKARSW